MKNKNGIILILIIVVGMNVYNYFIKPFKEKQEQRNIEYAKQEDIKIWSKPTIEFVDNFNCSEYLFKENNVKIEKFIVIDSYNESNDEKYCNVSLNTDLKIENYENFVNSYTRNVNEANVIIWIVQKTGKAEGTYENHTEAHRYFCEINFIEKVSKTIFKKEIINFIGDPPKSIDRKQGSIGGLEFFGEKPYKRILLAINNQLKTPNG